MGVPVWVCVPRSPGRADQAEGSVRILSAFREVNAFSELAELWLASLRQGIKESTYAHYQYTLHKYLLPVLGNLLVSSMTDSLLERLFLQILLPSDRSHKPLGASSAQECFGMLRRICKYAAHLHLMPPIEICVKLPHTQKPEPQPLTRTEQDSLREFLLSEPTTRKIGMLLHGTWIANRGGLRTAVGRF